MIVGGSPAVREATGTPVSMGMTCSDDTGKERGAGCAHIRTGLCHVGFATPLLDVVAGRCCGVGPAAPVRQSSLACACLARKDDAGPFELSWRVRRRQT